MKAMTANSGRPAAPAALCLSGSFFAAATKSAMVLMPLDAGTPTDRMVSLTRAIGARSRLRS